MRHLTRLATLTLALLTLDACRAKDVETTDTEVNTTDDADGDGFGLEEDCDDADAAVNPGAVELCDGVDNDCDGEIDVGAQDAATWYVDGDGDGYGDTSSAIEACEQPSGASDQGEDCDDSDPAVFPGAPEEDCADPVDYNCDGSVGYADGDGDGTPACEDCDDGDASVHPGAVEVCDDLDNDCDGLIDDADEDLDRSSGATWYADADADGYGTDDVQEQACEPSEGFVADSSDCDDGDAAVNPGAAEVCNGLDDDCDARVDDADDSLDSSTAASWYTDSDGDGYGDASSATLSCDAPSDGVSDASDCDDGDAAVNPGAAEVCNGLDDDCDALVDDADGSLDRSTATSWYTDGDGDGYGDASRATLSCDAPSDTVSDGSDCDDADGDINPGVSEVCGGVDQDCDGVAADYCESCLSILSNGQSSGDGTYTIDPDGSSGALPSTDVFCDMSTDGGGWTLVQRTVWDWSTESSQLLTDYTTFYTTTIGSPGVGSAYRLVGEAWGLLNVDLDHMFVHVARDNSDGSDCGALYYIGDSGALTVDASGMTLSGLNATVTMANAPNFQASGDSLCTASPYYAVPWYYSNCCTTCPTFAGSYFSTPRPMASYLNSTADLNGNTTANTCSSGVAVTSFGYEGENSMEYYLR